MASECMVVEALREQVDVVLVISGMGVHPDGLNLLNRAGFPVGLLFTESPYEDEQQARLARYAGHVFCNERSSARERGWGYVAAAYDPELHRPAENVAASCDVLIVGTGWRERQALLEGVDWTGIRLRVLGFWQGIDERSPLRPFYEPGGVDNEDLPALYASARVCVNQHRQGAGAESLNPRAYELAACGAYQVSDRRAELEDVFGSTVETYGSARELEDRIRWALSHDAVRRAMAREQRAKLLSGSHTFDQRAATLIAQITGGADVTSSRTRRPVLLAGRGRAGGPVQQRG